MTEKKGTTPSEYTKFYGKEWAKRNLHSSKPLTAEDYERIRRRYLEDPLFRFILTTLHMKPIKILE